MWAIISATNQKKAIVCRAGNRPSVPRKFIAAESGEAVLPSPRPHAKRLGSHLLAVGRAGPSDPLTACMIR